ncbi:hypothetical protein FA95DRAFT_1610493 [Auriscalpium vulgare]|uniref:Uncharacterized protein n=1 Tax=Auriscalpium vulgare TaxID=40419 RepID=A0ACB8RD95_9AGAM|nr:hypothetical protein FA95DRAFT_1610493 [Auriscalpium vulgare]
MSSPLASPVVKAPRMDMDPKARKRLEQQNIRFITNYWVDKIRLILAVDHTLSKNKTLKQIAIELRENHVLIKRLEDQSADLSMQIDARDGLLQSLRNQLSEKDEAIRALNVELDAFRAVLEKDSNNNP